MSIESGGGGGLGNEIDMGYEVFEILTSESVPVAAIVFLVWDIIDLLVELFQGRPRKLSTLTVARRLMQGRNVAAQLWGNGILRLLDGLDIVLSDSDRGAQRMLGQMRSQFIANLRAQGITNDRAQYIMNDVMFHTRSGHEPVALELQHAVDPSIHFWGPQKILDDYQSHYKDFIERGKDAVIAAKLALRWVMRHERWRDLLQISLSPPQPVIHPIHYPPPPPPNQTGPGDEFTQCCQETNTNLTTIITLLGGPPGGGPPSAASDCCVKILTLIQSLVTEVTAIATVMGAPPPGVEPPPAPDLTPIVDAINALQQCVCPPLARIASALDTPGPPPPFTPPAPPAAPARHIYTLEDAIADMQSAVSMLPGVAGQAS